MTPEQAALDALGAFIDAGVALDGAWNEVLDTGYPSRLPSFDEFLSELMQWREAVAGGTAAGRVTYGVGTRVMFRHDTDRYPHFIVPAGTEGTVTWEERGDMLVQIDGEVPGLTDSEEWQGEFQWYPSNGDEGEPPFVAITKEDRNG